MSFFSKWFKKLTEEEDDSADQRSSASPDRQSRDANADWSIIPEKRPSTLTLTRHILLRSAAPPQWEGVMQKLRIQGVEAEGGVHEGQVIAHYRGMTVTAEYIPAPLPNGEAEDNGKYNRMWPEAEQEIAGYAAQLLVTLRNAPNGLSGHRYLTQAIAALLAGEMNALAVYSAPLLVSRADYLASAELLKEKELPINLWVFVGLYGSEEAGGSAYTYGMADFGSEDFELLESPRSGDEIFELTFSVVHYAVSRNIRFQGGEEIAFGNRELKLTRSAGVALGGMTVKIEEG